MGLVAIRNPEFVSNICAQIEASCRSIKSRRQLNEPVFKRIKRDEENVCENRVHGLDKVQSKAVLRVKDR